MRKNLRRWFVGMLASACALAGRASAQEAAQPVSPPPAYILPAPTEPPIPDHLRPDPLLDSPAMPAPGPFLDADLAVLFPRFRNQLVNTVTTTPGTTTTVSFAGNSFDTAVAPRLEFGWHLPDGRGDLSVGYRFMVTNGADTLATPNGVAAQQGRLDFNDVDVAYSSREVFPTNPSWEMRWNIGARVATLYYDSRLAFTSPAAGAPLDEAETNSFWGVGPDFGLELSHHTGLTGLDIVGRVEASWLFGRIKQNFIEDVAGAPEGLTVRNESVGVPIVNAMVGVSYVIPEWHQSRLLLGYEFETWWQAGRLDDSRGQLDLNGIVLRAEFNF